MRQHKYPWTAARL